MRSAFTFFFLEIKVWMVKGIVLYSPITWLESPIKWLYVIVVLLKRLGASEKTMVGDAIFTMLSSMRHEKQTNEQTNKQTNVCPQQCECTWLEVNQRPQYKGTAGHPSSSRFQPETCNSDGCPPRRYITGSTEPVLHAWHSYISQLRFTHKVVVSL